MGWHAVDVDGTKMYENSNGLRMHSYQIDILEKAEKEAAEARKRSYQPRYSFEMDDEDEDHGESEPLGWIGMTIVIGTMTVIMTVIMIIIAAMSKGFPK